MLVLLAVTSEIAGTVKFLLLRVPKRFRRTRESDFFADRGLRSLTTDGCVSNHLRSVRIAGRLVRARKSGRRGLGRFEDREKLTCGACGNAGWVKGSPRAVSHAWRGFARRRDFGEGYEAVLRDVVRRICLTPHVVRMGCEVFSDMRRGSTSVRRTPIFCKHPE